MKWLPCPHFSMEYGKSQAKSVDFPVSSGAEANILSAFDCKIQGRGSSKDVQWGFPALWGNSSPLNV